MLKLRHHNVLLADAEAYLQGVSGRTGRELVPGWRDMLTSRLDRALGERGTFASPLHGRLWMAEQVPDLLLPPDEDDE